MSWTIEEAALNWRPRVYVIDEHLRRGIQLFNQREFFECHEVLEEAWMREHGPRRVFLQALIHFAVGFYHDQRGNGTGAERQLRKGLKKLSDYLPASEGVDTAQLYQDAAAALEQIDAGVSLSAYPSICYSSSGS